MLSNEKKDPLVTSTINNTNLLSTSNSIELIITHSGDSHTFTFDSNSTITLKSLFQLLHERFQVQISSQKLIYKGKILKSESLVSSESESETLISSLNSLNKSSSSSGGIVTYKLSLIGPKSKELNQFQSIESERLKKLSAFEFHKVHSRIGVRSTQVHGFGESEDGGQYIFHKIEPFPESVECYSLRKQMLEKLANDEAVLGIMKERKYVVGLLKELHPILQPTLLGLNKNAGEEISLRLLTDDLTGLRSYKTVRMVLLHELAHNVFGPHDNNFNELNSAHNKEVAESERIRGVGSGEYEVWQPSSTTLQEEELRRTTHTLNELDVGRREVLRFNEADEVEARRERVRLAAEKRRREEGNRGGN